MNPVYLRLLAYAVSGVLGLIPAAAAGLVTYNTATGILSIDLLGLVVAGLSAAGITGGIFAKWGIKTR